MISKEISNRLKWVLPTIISSEQSGFAPGKSIFEGVIVAHEVIHSLRMNKEAGMMLKLDIRKAYDNVNRLFLMRVLDKFGFSECWCKWIFSCIDSPRISILVNDNSQGYFEMEKDIRQGDLISPFLFIILVEVLGRAISKARREGRWRGLQVARGVDLVTHLQFVDDNFLMGEACIREAECMQFVLENYSNVTSQCINW